MTVASTTPLQWLLYYDFAVAHAVMGGVELQAQSPCNGYYDRGVLRPHNPINNNRVSANHQFSSLHEQMIGGALLA